VSVDFVRPEPVEGDLDVAWIHGSPRRRHRSDPLVQVHAYDEHTYLLRQSKDVTFEAPFLFLFFGDERALLVDSGATKDPEIRTVRTTVDAIVDRWLRDHPREDYRLVVAHTHAHGDHIAGDAQFADRPATTVVAPDVAAVRSFFGITDWPDQVVTFDLGGRVLDVVGCPGHHASSIAIYDPWTGLMLTGDTVYRGRLYAPDFPAFVASLNRLVGFAQQRRVTHVLGCHIEMAGKPGRDYPLGCRYQPSEPAPQLTVAQLRAGRDAAVAVADRPGVHRFDDFIIYNGTCRLGTAALVARALLRKLTLRR
jgi:hydroxyacylglutathione hydrolase